MSIQEKIAFVKNDLKGIDYEKIVGYNNSIGNTSYGSATESATEASNVFPWAIFDNFSTVSFSAIRSSASDSDKTLTINYLNQDFEELTTSVTLSAGANALPDMYRINSAVLSAPAVGNVTIQGSTPGGNTDVYKIPTGYTTSKHGIFTVPKGKKYALVSVSIVTPSEDGVGVEVRLRTHGATNFTGSQGFEVVTGANAAQFISTASTDLVAPYMLPEGTDLEMRVIKTFTGTAHNQEATCTLHLAKFHR